MSLPSDEAGHMEIADGNDARLRELAFRALGRTHPRIDLLARVGAYVEADVEPGEVWTDWNGARVGGTDDTVVREAIALDPTLPFEAFAFLIERSGFARRLAALHPSTTAEALRRLARDPASRVRQAALQHPRLPVDAMLAALTGDVEDAAVAIRHPGFPAEHLAQLAAHASAHVRAAVASATRDASLLDDLATDPSGAVAYAVADSAFASPEALAALATHTVEWVRVKVARNPRTAIATLEKLAADPARHVAEAVFTGPRVTEPMIAAFSGDFYRATDVARNERSSPAIRAAASRVVRARGDWLSRSLVAREIADREELTHYARDEVHRVREAVARNPFTPREIVELLASDPHEAVRAAVKER